VKIALDERKLFVEQNMTDSIDAHYRFVTQWSWNLKEKRVTK